MKIGFTQREREIILGLMIIAKRSFADGRNKQHKKARKLANKLVNKFSGTADQTDIKINELNELIKILEFVAKTAGETDDEGRRKIEEEDEKTIKEAIARIEAVLE